MRLKKNDKVMVITGKYRNQTGKIIKTFPEKSRILVEGINIATKHKKPLKRGEKGTIEKIERPIHISNVMYFSSDEGVRSRIGYSFKDGEKIKANKARVIKKTNNFIKEIN